MEYKPGSGHTSKGVRARMNGDLWRKHYPQCWLSDFTVHAIFRAPVEKWPPVAACFMNPGKTEVVHYKKNTIKINLLKGDGMG